VSDRQANPPRATCIARTGYPELESAFLDEVVRRRAADPWTELLVVVPSRNLRARLREALLDRTGGAFGLHVVLFPDLARRLLEESGEAPAPVDDLAALLVLSELGRDRKEAPESPFRTVAARSGFHESLFESVVELEESGYEAGDSGGPGEAGFPPRLREVLALHRAWRKRLEERSILTTAGLIRRAAVVSSTVPAGPPVLVYGVYDFTGNQRRLLEGLSMRRSLTIFLPLFPAADGAYAAPARAWIESLAGPIDSAAGVEPEGPPVGAPTVEFFNAPGERREALEVARRVLGLIDRGVEPDDIGVVYRAAEPYARLVTEAFERAGIAVAGGAAPPLAETRVGRTLRHLVAAARGERDRRELLDLFDLVLADARAHRVAEWESWTREAGITRGRAAWRDGLERLSRNPDIPSGSLGELREELDRLAPLLDLLAAPPRFHDAARALLDAGRRWFPDDADWPDAETALERLAELDRAGVPPTAQALDWLLGRLLAAQRRRPRDRRRGVRLFDVVAARGLSFGHLFLLGLTERVFPRVVTQDPILLDADRRLLASRTAWLPPRRAGVDEERLLFRLMADAAPRITMSWTRLDPATGRPRIPSSFLLEAAARGRSAPLDFEGLENAATRVPLDRMAEVREAARRAPGPVLPAGYEPITLDDPAELDRLLLASALGADRLDRVAALLAGEDIERRRRAERARYSPRLTAGDGALEDPELVERLAARFGDGHVWSASQLETYARCPHRFFLERLLGLEELDAPEDVVRVSAADRGGVLHDILRRFLLDPATGPLVPERRAELRQALRALATRRLAAFAGGAQVGGRLLWRLDAARATDDLLDWLDFELSRDDPRRPARFEARFGLRPTPGRDEDAASTTEGPELTLPDGAILRFGGYVDRIDLDETGTAARVLDYKTGKPPDARPKTPLDGGARLQLALYRLALERLVPGLVTGDAAYLYLKGPVVEEELTDAEFAAVRGDLARVAGTLRDGLRAGLVFARPADAASGGRCPCPFKSICGADRGRVFERKQADPRMAPLLELEAAAGGAAADAAAGEEE
jgi:ATP-dependent helicase/nuclease subunit B